MGAQADSIVKDTVFQNFIIDSLKQAVLASKNDSSLINALCLLGQNSSAKQRMILGKEVVLQSQKLGYKREVLRGELMLANYLTFQQKYPSADSAYTEIIRKAEILKDEYILCRAYAQKGEIYRLTYRLDSSEIFYKNALGFAEKIKDEEIIAFVYSTWSNVFDKKGDYKKALEMDSIAVFIAHKQKDYARLSFTISQMGEIFRLRGDLPRALKCMQESLHYGTLINNKRRIVFSLITIGHIYSMEDDFVNAEKNYLSALEKVAETDKINISTITNSLATLYFNTKQFEKSLLYNRKALALAKEINESSVQQFSYFCMGEIYREYKQHDSAEYYLLKALKLAEELKIPDLSSMSNKSLGQLYFAMSNLPKAEAHSKASLAQAMETNMLSNVKESTHSLYTIYKSEQKYKEALVMHEMYLSAKDSSTNENQIRALEKVRYKEKEENLKINQKMRDKAYAAEKSKKDEEIKNQKLIRNMFLFGFIVFVLVAFLIFRSLVQNRKAKRIIEEQKRQVELQKSYVEEHQREIIDSITYARRIQQSLLPTEKYIEKTLKRLKKDKFP